MNAKYRIFAINDCSYRPMRLLEKIARHCKSGLLTCFGSSVGMLGKAMCVFSDQTNSFRNAYNHSGSLKIVNLKF